MMVVPVILSGGTGSRLWPISRKKQPKPFITLPDGHCLLQHTYQRALTLMPTEVITVTNQEYYHATQACFEKAAANVDHTLILEPSARNSAAAISLAAHYLQEKYGDDTILLVMPADHYVSDSDAFLTAIEAATTLALAGQLVTFGVTPTEAHTGYGYLKANGTHVEQFIEKPDLQTAQLLVAESNYFWNTGIFCMQAHSILQALEQHAPHIASQTKIGIRNATHRAQPSHQCLLIAAQDFAPLPDISIDYAVFEKSDRVSVVPFGAQWSDLGTWTRLAEQYPSDENNNQIIGDTLCKDTSDCIIHNNHNNERLVATLGIEHLIIADTPDALLVAHKDRAEDVKHLVQTLADQEHECHNTFHTVQRPWGSYTVLHNHPGYKVKKITVHPGCQLSLQSHIHRSEHWVVVEGTAWVTHNKKHFALNTNESSYIPAGDIHRLENKTASDLIIIEVQCGNYLGEDDIIRYDDIYGRADDDKKIQRGTLNIDS